MFELELQDAAQSIRKQACPLKCKYDIPLMRLRAIRHDAVKGHLQDDPCRRPNCATRTWKGDVRILQFKANARSLVWFPVS